MVSIRDNDIKDEWSRNEWGDYELWEKVEVRLKRRRWLLVGITAVIFLLLSCVPIIQNHISSWAGWSASVQFSKQIIQMKTDASTEHLAYRIRMMSEEELSFVVERASRCTDSVFQPVYSGMIQNRFLWKNIRLLKPEQSKAMGYSHVIETFCYDPIDGAQHSEGGADPSEWSVFAFLVDSQISVLILSGKSAEISWE